MSASKLIIVLNASTAQTEALLSLQVQFAQACNAIAPLVRDRHCWNRVALHHLVYQTLRASFPHLGSQMACNVIYSVSRTARLVYQHPKSPWNFSNNPGQALPLLRFLPGSPVYFDRHTLSIKEGQLSLFTLDGRMRFQLNLGAADEMRFRDQKLREIVLSQSAGRFALQFNFAEAADLAREGALEWADLPEYLIVQPPNPSLENAIPVNPPPGAVAMPALSEMQFAA